MPREAFEKEWNENRGLHWVDANVLIDYIQVEETKVLRLVTEHLFPIKLPREILHEVNGLTQDRAEALGMEIIEPTFDKMRETASRGGALWQVDKLCFAIARDTGVEFPRNPSAAPLW